MSDTAHIDVHYLARLARVQLDDAECARFATQLDAVMDYFSRIQAVDVTDIEPLRQPFPLANVWGADQPADVLAPATALANAPAARDQQFVVPKVVEDA
jgi:aspartyl-tRNA(Asn)/glutamyl-tRNA(Gln) amidotransferase subunit C